MQRTNIFALTLLLAACPATFACSTDDGAGETTDEVSEDTDSTETADDETGSDESDGDNEDSDDENTDGDGDTATSDDPSDDVATDDTSDDDTDAEDTDADDTATDEDNADGTATDEDNATDDDTATDEDTSDGTDATDDDTSAEDTDEDTSDDTSGEIPVGTIKTGSVSLTQTILAAAGQEFVTATASAGFQIINFEEGTVPAPNPTCDTQIVGACALTVCDTSDAPPDEEDPPTTLSTLSAGVVTIEGTHETLMLTPGDTGQYTAVTQMERFWEGGESVTASAPGSDGVPAFSLELTAPIAVTLTSPVLDVLTPTTVSRSEPLEVAWSDGNEGTIRIYVVDQALSMDIVRTVMCQVPAADGSVNISEELLAAFSDEGLLSASIETTENTTVQDWSITFMASGSLTSGALAFTD